MMPEPKTELFDAKRVAKPKRTLKISYQGRDNEIDLSALEANNKTLFRIGKASDNNIVIPNDVVDPYHATLTCKPDGHWYIIDGQDRTQSGYYQRSTRGLFYNDGRRVYDEHLLSPGDSIHILGYGQPTVTFSYYDQIEAGAKLQRVPLGRDECNIGRNSTNDMILPDIMVSSLHARVIWEKGKHVLIHLSRTNPTLVNQKPISRQTLNPGDQISIGPFNLFYDGSSLSPSSTAVIKGPRVDAINVSRAVKTRPNFIVALRSFKNFGNFLFGKKKSLLQNITLPIQPGDFVALVGGSGTGKSTLLKSMIGILDTEKGSQIKINDEDLFSNYDRYRSEIGYVPQEDIIHDDLTVDQVLTYAIRLRKSASRRNRKKLIEDILSKLQLLGQRSQLVRQLSGGQRKRLNVAVELAANPTILVLDEPTSGLDPGLDLVLMDELARLSREDHKTIILVTHTTENIDKCNKVAFLARGGRLAFYGSPAEARQFFSVTSFPAIYEELNKENWRKDWPEEYKHSVYYQVYVAAYQQPAPPALPAKGQKQPKVRKGGFWESIRQTIILAQRYVQNNLFSIITLLILPAILALLFFLVAKPELFTTIVFQKGDLKTPTEILTIDTRKIEFSKELFSIQQVIFMVATVSVLLGLFGSYQEIVKERSIYERERLVNLSIPAYVLSKFSVLFFLAALQALIMMFVLDYWVKISGEGLTPYGPRWEVAITIFLIILASTALGLFVSALVNRKRESTIIALVLLVTIQIIFSGAIFELKDNSAPLTWMTFTRWGSEAMGSSVGIYALTQHPYLNVFTENLKMDYGDLSALYRHWEILAGYVLGLLTLTIFVLWRQDIVRKRAKRK
jgi:ABC-type multidrug transport system ATPase subunit/pSer/pThr/pTyr-binding forkhead associated (FHA) protein/ABC-type multidrug transport system permease subunit